MAQAENHQFPSCWKAHSAHWRCSRSLPATRPSPAATMSASLASFAPAVALRAPRAAAPRRGASAVTRASAPSPSESKPPVLDRRRAVLGVGVAAAMSFCVTPGNAEAKAANGVYWISPKDGAVVEKKFTVKMGVIGLELAPASEGMQEGTGHHHVVVDIGKKGYVEKGEAIAFDATHLHYGKAQKEAVVELTPGTHTLTLQFANAKHESFGKKFAKTITVTVA